MEQVENRMVNTAVWPDTPKEVKEKLRGPGYCGVDRDIFVPEENAFDYALDQCVIEWKRFLHETKWTDEFKEMLVDWFYSDDKWRKEE